jgi:hypothetical protein
VIKTAFVSGCLISAAASPTVAKARHTWFNVDYAMGKCVISTQTPEEVYNMFANGAPGLVFDRIAPDEVTKDDDDTIHVHMTGTKDGSRVYMNFFTKLSSCKKFIADFGITAKQADDGDIN